MKTRQLIRHSALFVVGFAAFGLSIMAAIHISDAPMDTYFGAIWMFVQILISLVGLITLPIFMLSLLVRIIGIAIQPSSKQPPVKRKRTSWDTIAS